MQVTIPNTNNLQLDRIKYSYLIQLIFLRIYLTHKWDPNWYYHTRQSEHGSNGNEVTPFSPELEPCYQMQFNVIPRTSFSEKVGVLPLHRE